MQFQLPPGIEKLARIEPQQLKKEQQLFQPKQTVSHVSLLKGQQQLPGLTMPLAQWQVVRMIHVPQPLESSDKEVVYRQQQMWSSMLQLPSERGVLSAKFELEGQAHQVRWQIVNGEVVLLTSTLFGEQALKLVPTLSGGWRLVSHGVDMAEPLQLLWMPGSLQNNKLILRDTQRIWLKRSFYIIVILALLYLLLLK
ncbi:hypothetical protein [Vibrio sp.]|uniref:hypothetical protein n=1 Tax=Vibrio sp. TaxID=678 RepID=UPI00378ED336